MDANVLHWQVHVDPKATRQAHDAMACGGPETCGCLYCKNFAASRDLAYPPEAMRLFEGLGIRSTRETEIGAPLRLDQGRWLYGGWFHFVGEIVEGPREPGPSTTVAEQGPIRGGTMHKLEYHTLVPGFELLLSEQRHLLPDTFGEQPVVQLEFSTEVPWILSEKEPAS